MKNYFLILFISSLLIGCNKTISPSEINKINGYWEIEKVVLPDGEAKEYAMNESFDYFKINNNKGFRKKVMPQLDGTFLVNDDFEKVEIRAEDGKYFIYYITSFAKWKEELLSVSDETLVILNESEKEYHYKRAAPINIIGNDKKNQ